MKKLLFIIVICIFSSKIQAYKLQKFNLNLNYPWGMTWIDSTKLLITEKKTSRIILFDTSNNTSKIISHQIPVAAWGQGGLLDIISENDNVWVTCSIMKNKLLTTAVYKSTLQNDSLVDSELIFEAIPYINNAKHFGSRMTIKDDYLYISDEENRKKIPNNIPDPLLPKFKDDPILEDIKKMVNDLFHNHPGDTKNYWLGTSRKDALKALDLFIKDKINNFGDYEDAVRKHSPFLFHSVLSPYLNLGLITPKDVIKKVLDANKIKEIPINSLEGFIRQLIGWREFMRGIYHNFNERLEKTNFFNHQRKLSEDWYNGTTGIDPIDDAINDVNRYGYAHHIIRLMHLSNVMTLSQLHPKEIYKWFMEMFVDSSDWVMSPNVFGMGTYSDGGIFSTKPYICGSNYIIKMSNYKKGNWSDIVDGLYWNFIHDNKDVLSKNPRMGMVMMSYRKLKEDRKSYLLNIANEFIAKKTL
ncbi:cryptochrome/photolyase family protein [Alphaproteobacteria bacterium]|nr:cryptochrome/photolyase family protein [Alphaproteobacteria bacterium]